MTNEIREACDDWVANKGEFWGTARQLTECAKCGEPIKGGYNTPRHVRDTFKPSMHFLCDGCYEDLPN